MSRLPIPIRRRRSRRDRATDLARIGQAIVVAKLASVAARTARSTAGTVGGARRRPRRAGLIALPLAVGGGALTWRAISHRHHDHDHASYESSLGPVAAPGTVSPPDVRTHEARAQDAANGATSPRFAHETT